MTKGVEELLANVTKLQAKAPRAARAAVSEVAEEFEKELRANTPVTSGDLQSDTAVSGFKGGTVGIISKDIGYGKGTGWRSRFPDDGTIYQKSQHFKERTINTMTPKAQGIYAKKIKEELGL